MSSTHPYTLYSARRSVIECAYNGFEGSTVMLSDKARFFWLGVLIVGFAALGWLANQQRAANSAQAQREAIQAHQIWIGMTQSQVRQSFGKPQRISRTTRARGVSEQWIYERAHLFFDDGVLVTIQE
jgi:hypothetical protein